MGRSRIIFMGTPAFAVPSLIALIEAGHEIALVVTRQDKPRGRGLATAPSEIKKAALDHGLKVIEPRSLKEPGFTETIKGLNPDFIVVVAYGKILPPEVLRVPAKGCVNLHASLLPKYRGAAPINWAIVNGEKETGVSTMLMDEGMDTGPVLLKEKAPIGDTQTAEDLATGLASIGARLLAKTLLLLEEGGVTAEPQDGKEATYSPVLKKEDGRIHWSKSAVGIKDLIRGLYPWPGAYTIWNGKILKIHGGVAGAASGGNDGEPGEVMDASNGTISVKCGDGIFRITELQPENKRRMSADDFIKGYRIRKGDRFDQES